MVFQRHPWPLEDAESHVERLSIESTGTYKHSPIPEQNHLVYISASALSGVFMVKREDWIVYRPLHYAFR